MDGWGTGEQGLEESVSPSMGEGGGRRWRCPLGWNEVSTAAEHLTTDSWLKATQAGCVPVSVGCHLRRKLGSGHRSRGASITVSGSRHCRLELRAPFHCTG